MGQKEIKTSETLPALKTTNLRAVYLLKKSGRVITVLFPVVLHSFLS
jgi:hypothetical protein